MGFSTFFQIVVRSGNEKKHTATRYEVHVGVFYVRKGVTTVGEFSVTFIRAPSIHRPWSKYSQRTGDADGSLTTREPDTLFISHATIPPERSLFASPVGNRVHSEIERLVRPLVNCGLRNGTYGANRSAFLQFSSLFRFIPARPEIFQCAESPWFRSGSNRTLRMSGRDARRHTCLPFLSHFLDSVLRGRPGRIHGSTEGKFDNPLHGRLAFTLRTP